jgi:hypothetical protein
MKNVFFLYFSGFTDLDRAVTFLLVKKIFYFKTAKSLVKALSKTFYILFCSMKSSCPKRCVNASTAPDFCRGSVVYQSISGGGA